MSHDRRKLYSDEDVKGILADYHNGFTAKEITVKWGVCSTMLYVYLKKSGVTFRKNQRNWDDIKKSFGYMMEERK